MLGASSNPLLISQRRFYCLQILHTANSTLKAENVFYAFKKHLKINLERFLLLDSCVVLSSVIQKASESSFVGLEHTPLVSDLYFISFHTFHKTSDKAVELE